MEYLKPALTLQEQAELLLSRGMIGERDQIAERLGSVSYYRLTGYWFPFRESDDSFKSGTTFDEVWSRYAFDRQLRCLVLDAIERIEIFLRTQLSLQHSHAYGPFGYAINPDSIHKPESKHYLKFLEKVSEEKKQSGERFATHFREKYGDCHEYLPIWMATEMMSYGTAMSLYNHCPIEIRNAVASEFNLPQKTLSSWLLTLNTVRNACAHHSRLWNRTLGVKPKVPKKRTQPDWHIPEPFRNDCVYAPLTFCRYSLKKIAPQSCWKQRLLKLLDDYPNIPLDDMGFPERWGESPIWKD